jgi:asparagine synthase (glutamine-hydrolysing)
VRATYTELKRVLRRLVGAEGRALAGLSTADRELIARVRAANLTYLSDSKLRSLVESCHRVETSGTPGIFIEAGCALGGSSIVIATLKSDSRPFRVYDVFGMIPPPTSEDPAEVHERYRIIKGGGSQGLGGNRYYGYESDLYRLVLGNLETFGIDCERQQVSLVQGLVQDTLWVDEPVAFAHVDVDWYEPVKTCLERIVPRLMPGGVLILDDYLDWGGCKKAADEYFSQAASGEFRMDDSAGSMKITRIVH